MLFILYWDDCVSAHMENFAHVDELDLVLQLIETGEKEKLMELLRERLIECGWRDEMRALCRFEIFPLLLFMPQNKCLIAYRISVLATCFSTQLYLYPLNSWPVSPCCCIHDNLS